MQYYRLWIYACNLVLGLTSAIFIIFAAFVVADVRLSLLEGVELYHPTFFYAYGALFFQCGVVQAIGCLGAQRLSHKLLSLYWTLLLLLTLGDIGVGLYWVFRLEKVKINLLPYLSREFIEKYSTDETFTIRWNKIQSQDRCCGVDGPLDFEKFSSSHSAQHSSSSSSSALKHNSHVIVDVDSGLLLSVPASCCILLYVPSSVGGSGGGPGLDKAYSVPHYPLEEEHPPYNDQPPGPGTTSSKNHRAHLHPPDYWYDGDGGGSRSLPRRRGRTVDAVNNFPHKNDEPHHYHYHHLPRGNDEEAEFIGGNEIDTDFYYDHRDHESQDDFEDKKLSFVVGDVPDDDDHKEPGPNQGALEEKRDIKTYEPIHAHKVRHELHRKSQPSSSSSLIDSNNDSSNTSASIFLASSTNTSGEILAIPRSRRKSSTIHKKKNKWKESRNTKKEQVHQKHNQNQTNKLFPSMSKDRALEKVERKQHNLLCHKQPEVENHHNSNRKDLEDQRKTQVEDHKSPETRKFTSAEKIGESLLAGKKSERIMNYERMQQDQVRDEDDMSLSSRNIVLELRRSRKVEQDNSGKYDFFPVSSSASSTTYLETNTPIIYPPNAPFIQTGEATWTEINNSTNNNTANANNASFLPSTSATASGKDALEKKLYVYGAGCGVKLLEWVDHVSGIMLILGFCIIGFVKTCFLVILRTEIREMIEKINMIEPEEVILMSPTKATKSGSLIGVTHPLLMNPHRSSTVSAHGMLLPTIKSPDGPSSFISDIGGIGCMPGMGGVGVGGGCSPGMYNRPMGSRHYLRRASNIVGGDRSRSHSNETMNVGQLLAQQHDPNAGKGRSNPNLSSAPGSSGTIANLEEKDPMSGLSITVPSSTSSSYIGPAPNAAAAAVRYLRRSSTCSSSTNPTSFPYMFGIDSEPRPGPSHRLYYFDTAYQPQPYQQHHHHHYMRNRSHSRNMSCGAILPLTSYRTNSAAAAASAAYVFNRVVRQNPATLSSATTTTTSYMPASTGCSFSSNSKDETEMIVSVSLEHIPSSDQDEEREDDKTTAPEIEEDIDKQEQVKKDWAGATQFRQASPVTKRIDEEDESLGTNLDTFYIDEECSTAEESNPRANRQATGSSEAELQRRNGNNNVDLTNSLPMSYIGTAV